MFLYVKAISPYADAGKTNTQQQNQTYTIYFPRGEKKSCFIACTWKFSLFQTLYTFASHPATASNSFLSHTHILILSWTSALPNVGISYFLCPDSLSSLFQDDFCSIRPSLDSILEMILVTPSLGLSPFPPASPVFLRQSFILSRCNFRWVCLFHCGTHKDALSWE